MRLDKYLANSGIGTRSEIKKIIAKGLVQVNSVTIKDCGAKVTEGDEVLVSGEQISSEEFLYFIMDKPECVLTAMEDPRLSTIGDLIPANLKNRKLSPVGRLDYHTTGLIIITNDGTLSHRLTSPKYKIPKTYLVGYEGEKLTHEHVELFAQGITLHDTDEDIELKPAKLELRDDSTCLLTISEGKTHQVKRMLAHFGRSVVTLRRISIGEIKTPEGAPGELIKLNSGEVAYLKRETGL